MGYYTSKHIMTGAEFKLAVAGAVRGLGKGSPIKYRGKSGVVEFRNFKCQFAGRGAFTSFVRQREAGTWVYSGLINLPFVPDTAEITRELTNNTIGYVVHELLHVLMTSFKEFKEVRDTAHGDAYDLHGCSELARRAGQWLKTISNSACDVRIEAQNKRLLMYIGAIPCLEALIAHFIEEGHETFDPATWASVGWTIKVLGLAEIAGYNLPHVAEYRERLATNPELESTVNKVLLMIRRAPYDDHGREMFAKLINLFVPLANNIAKPPPPKDDDVMVNPGGETAPCDEEGEEGEGEEGEGEEGEHDNAPSSDDMDWDDDYDCDDEDESDDEGEDEGESTDDTPDGDEAGDETGDEKSETETDELDEDEDNGAPEGESSSSRGGATGERFDAQDLLDEDECNVEGSIEEMLNEIAQEAYQMGVTVPMDFAEREVPVIELS